MDEKGKNKLFREKSIERISSPEKLNDYIKVANPGVWIILIAVIILLFGFFIWACTAKLQTTVNGVVDVQMGASNCYVPEEAVDNGSITLGMKVQCGNNSYEITEISDDSLEAQQVLTDYAIHLGGFTDGEWVRALSINSDLDEGSYGASVVIQETSPITFLFNN